MRVSLLQLNANTPSIKPTSTAKSDWPRVCRMHPRRLTSNTRLSDQRPTSIAVDRCALPVDDLYLLLRHSAPTQRLSATVDCLSNAIQYLQRPTTTCCVAPTLPTTALYQRQRIDLPTRLLPTLTTAFRQLSTHSPPTPTGLQGRTLRDPTPTRRAQVRRLQLRHLADPHRLSVA